MGTGAIQKPVKRVTFSSYNNVVIKTSYHKHDYEGEEVKCKEALRLSASKAALLYEAGF